MRRTELLELCPRSAVDAAARSGSLERHGRSCLALPGTAADATAARRTGGVLVGLSAARAWGWKVKVEPRCPQVAVPRSRHHAYGDLAVIRRDIATTDITGDRLTRVAAVVDCARTLAFDEALAVADSALREGRVTREDLLARAAGLSRGRVRATRVIALADGRAANPFESVARAIAVGVPGLQVVPQGWVGGDKHSDLVDQHLRIAIECDSWAFHADERAWRYDVRRYNELAADGWLVLRLLWEQVMARQQEVQRLLTRAVTVAAARA